MIAAYLVALASVTVGQTASVTPAGSLAGVDHPARLAALAGGGVYVTDTQAGEVIEFDAAGAEVARFAVAQGPVGVAVGTGGQVYVSRMDGNVGVYDAAFVQQSLLNPAPAAMVAPNGIAVDPTTGNVFVADTQANAVFVFDGAAGTLLTTWGTFGSGLGEFASPTAIAIDANLGHVIVADADNSRVQVFDTAGMFLFKFGYKTLYVGSSQLAWFARSSGIAVDDCSNIYIADALMGTLRVYDSSGKEIDYTTPLVSMPATAAGASTLADVMIAGTKLYLSNNAATVDAYDLACTAIAPRMATRNEETTGSLRKDRVARMGITPDNPLVIVEALQTGMYDPALDLDRDRRVSMRDLEIAVDAFGAATVDDFLAMGHSPLAAAPLAGPHFMDIPNLCGRCHALNGTPGGMLSEWGQANLCGSCHMSDGVALDAPLAFADFGMHHPVGVAADAGSAVGPAAGSDLLDHLEGGDIRCGTCHEPHDFFAGTCTIPSAGMPTPQPHIGRCMGGPMNGKLCQSDGQCDLGYLRATGDDVQLCSECHAEYDEWTHAGHADELGDPFSHYNWNLSSRSACRYCHSGNGFIDFSEGKAAAAQNGDFRVIDCTTCHATHGKPQSEELLRVFGEVTVPADPVNFPGGLLLTNKGGSATCYVCHNGRSVPPTQNTNPTPVSTPHYALGGVMLEGVNAVEFGNTSLTNSAHTTLASCVACHMAPGPAAGNPGAGKVGGHTFALAVHDPADPDYGFENAVSACGNCHPGLTTLNRPSADYDGDGVPEGVQVETQGLLDLVLAELQARGAVQLGGYPYWDLNGVAVGDRILVKNCIWNWEYVDNSGDLGVKNTSYAVGILQLTYQQLAGQVVPNAILRYVP